MKPFSPFAAIPLSLLVAAAVFEQLRLAVMLALLLGLVVTLLAQRGPTGRPIPGILLVHTACLLVAINLVWDSLRLPAWLPGDASCADVLSPFAVYRAAGAAIFLTCLLLVTLLARAAPSEIGLRWPSRGWMVLSLGALPAIGTAAALIGPPLAEPFFGPLPSAADDLRALIPALLFAIANSCMEETAYRGALLRWLTPTIGVSSALALQAVVFGLAHGVGTDFTGSPLPVMAATAAAGLVFGALALRSGSLLVPIAVHIALDIPVYYGKVCLGT